MRLGLNTTVRCVFYVLLVLALQLAPPLATCHASSTNVFAAKSALLGAGIASSGGLSLKFKGGSSLILGTNATDSSLAVAVFNMDCVDMVVNPTIQLVAYNRSQNRILAPLVEFTTYGRIYSDDDKMILQTHGVGLSGVDGGDLDALITIAFHPCAANEGPSVPTSVSIEPIGTIKPAGQVPYATPPTPDEGAIYFFTDDVNHPVLQVAVSGEATEPALVCSVNLSVNSVAFGNVLVGAEATQTITLHNNGGTACTVQSLTFNGSTAFGLSTNLTTPFLLAANRSINVPVTYQPVTAGADSTVLRVTSTDINNPEQYINLAGAGITNTPCNISASPLALTFVSSNQTLSVTITNSGETACAVDTLTIVPQNSDFKLVPAVQTGTVAPGSSISVTVVYTPTSVSNATGTLEIDNGDPDNRLILVSLSETGVTATCALAIPSTPLDFGAVVVGQKSDLTVSITNNSTVACSIDSISFSGSPAFALNPAITNLELNSGESTNLVFEFTPASNGLATATVTISTPNSSTTIPLSGTGATLSPTCTATISQTNLQFGDVAVGATNVVKFKVSNTSQNSCSIQTLHLNGSPNFLVVAPPLPIQIDALANVEIGVQYTPGAPGIDSGTLQVVGEDSVINTISLVGTGVQAEVALSTTNLNYGSLAVGSNVTLTAFITNTTTVAATIQSISLSGSTDFILNPFVPTSQFKLAPGAIVQIPIIYLPSILGAEAATVTIASDALGAPFTISLSGVGLQSDLSVSPVGLNFGTGVLGGTNNLAVTITNAGNTLATVDSIEEVGSSRFLVTSPIAPFGVPAGGSVSVNVEYLPINIETIIILGGTVKTSGKPTIVNP